MPGSCTTCGRGTCVHEALRDLTTHDVRRACDVLRPAYDASNGVDGRASIEVDPRLAYDTEATIAEARALWWRVDRPNLFIKIAAAREGLPAITACLAEGISVNVTLIFSLTRYDEVMDAFAERPGAGRRPATTWPGSRRWPRSSSPGWTPRSTRGWTRSAPPRRPRCAAGPRSPTRGWPTALRGDARLAALGRAGGGRGPAAAAAVGLDLGQGPGLPRHHVRDKLVAPGVVNTMPEATLRAVADHGEVPADSVRGRYADARQVLERAGRGRHRLRRRHRGPGAAGPGTVRRQLTGAQRPADRQAAQSVPFMKVHSRQESGDD